MRQKAEGSARFPCLLPTASCLLPTAYCLLPTASCLLPTASCLCLRRVRKRPQSIQQISVTKTPAAGRALANACASGHLASERNKIVAGLEHKAPTTLGTWSAAVLRALEARGVDAAAVAKRAGIDPDALVDPNFRVPRAA